MIQLKLKDRKILMNECVLMVGEEIQIEPKIIKNRKFYIKFNDQDYVKLDKLTLPIPKELFEKETLKIVIKEVNPSNDVLHIYGSDEIPLTKFYYLGNHLRKKYPKEFYEVDFRIKKLEERLLKLESEGDIL